MVSEAISSALTLIQPQAEAKGLELAVNFGPHSLPAYIGDDERVRQILVNLLSNAVKCTEPGGTITVEGALTTMPDRRAHLQSRSAYIRLTVADTGSGIPEEKLRAIFEPFVQAEMGTTRPREGSGLGLTIGLRLARAMGGDITVESAVGKGSSFSLWLPADVSAIERAADDEGTIDASTAGAMGDDGDGVATAVATSPRPQKGLGEVAHGVLAKLEQLVTVVVGRIRAEPNMPMAAGLRTSQVTDHLSTLLADIAGALIVVDEAGGESSQLLADAIEIQRLVSERHGAQRARLGWTEATMRREFMIIREELERVARESMPPDGTLEPSDAIAMINRFVDRAEYLGVRELEKARRK
jgi:hypothetical protein